MSKVCSVAAILQGDLLPDPATRVSGVGGITRCIMLPRTLYNVRPPDTAGQPTAVSHSTKARQGPGQSIPEPTTNSKLNGILYRVMVYVRVYWLNDLL